MKTNLPETASATELSDLLGIGSRHLRKLAEIGVVVRADGGGYDLAASVRNYMRHVSEASRRMRGSTAATDLREARAEAIRRRLDRQAATLVEAAEVAECLETVAALAGEEMVALLESHDEPLRVGLEPAIAEARARVVRGRDAALVSLRDGLPKG